MISGTDFEMSILSKKSLLTQERKSQMLNEKELLNVVLNEETQKLLGVTKTEQRYSWANALLGKLKKTIDLTGRDHERICIFET